MKTMKNMKKLFLTIVIALASMALFASNSSVEAKLSMGASRIFALNQESGYLADGLVLAVETSMTTDYFTTVAAGSYTYSTDISVADATLSLRRPPDRQVLHVRGSRCRYQDGHGFRPRFLCTLQRRNVLRFFSKAGPCLQCRTESPSPGNDRC